MLVMVLLGFFMLMPALGLVFIGLALAPERRSLGFLWILGLILFGFSFYSLHVKQEILFYLFFILGPFLFGLGLPLRLEKSKRLQAGISGVGILLVFSLFLYLVSQLLNHV